MSDIAYAWEFVIFIHSLIITQICQPAFPVVYYLKRAGMISCTIDRTVDSLPHSLGHCVTLEKLPMLHCTKSGTALICMFGRLRPTIPDTFCVIVYQP